MIAVTFNSATAYLLDDWPDDWRFNLGAKLPAHAEGGMTGRETRRPLGDTLRISLRYGSLLQSGAIQAMRNSLQDLKDKVVLCPFWLAGFAPGASPTVTASFYVLCGDDAPADVQPASALPFSRPAYPLMVGYLYETPDPVLFDGERGEVEIDFVEADDWALTFPAATIVSTLQGFPLLPFQPNWADSPHSGGAEVEIERRAIGQGRKQASAFYDQPARRAARQVFTLVTADALKLLRFYQDYNTVKPFWLPVGITEARLTQWVQTYDITLQVDSPAIGNNRYVILDDTVNRVPLYLSGVGYTYGGQGQFLSGTWSVPSPVGTYFDYTNTRIESMMLARFSAASIAIKFDSSDVCSAELDFIETPLETGTPPAGETTGVTMGALPTNAYLYDFSVAYPGATQHWRFTSFERDLSDGTNTWAKQWFDDDNITETATLERQQVNILTRNFVGNPIGMLVPFALEWPLRVDIYEADVTGSVAGNLRCLFSGEVGEARIDGPFLNATASSLSTLFDRRFPRFLMQPECNLVNFEPRCGLLATDWHWRGNVQNWDRPSMTFNIWSFARVSGTTIVIPEHFFAGGYLVIGSGTSAQYRMIANSHTVNSGTITATVTSDFTVQPTNGMTVDVYPGCDGRRESCLAFGNYAKFMGFPFMPISNPSALAVRKGVSGGGKK